MAYKLITVRFCLWWCMEMPHWQVRVLTKRLSKCLKHAPIRLAVQFILSSITKLALPLLVLRMHARQSIVPMLPKWFMRRFCMSMAMTLKRLYLPLNWPWITAVNLAKMLCWIFSVIAVMVTTNLTSHLPRSH